jgi:hypothetical protein
MRITRLLRVAPTPPHPGPPTHRGSPIFSAPKDRDGSTDENGLGESQRRSAPGFHVRHLLKDPRVKKGFYPENFDRVFRAAGEAVAALRLLLRYRSSRRIGRACCEDLNSLVPTARTLRL